MNYRAASSYGVGQTNIAPPGEDALTSLFLGRTRVRSDTPNTHRVAEAGQPMGEQRSGPSYETLMAKSRELSNAGRFEDARRVAEIALKRRGNPTGSQLSMDQLGALARAREKMQGNQSTPEGFANASQQQEQMQTFEVQLPDGRVLEVQANSMEEAAQGAKSFGNQSPNRMEAVLEAERRGILPSEMEAPLAEARKRGLVGQSSPTPSSPALSNGLASLSQLSTELNGQAPIQRTNAMLGGVMPSPKQAIRNMIENVMGDNDPSTLNRGEALASALNKGGESMTLGLFGDEAAGQFDQAVGRGEADERSEFYRDQEEQLWEQHPGKAMTAEISGALLGPGKGASAFVNAGRGAINKIVRGGTVGAGAGAIYGAAEGEDSASRATGAALGGLTGLAGGAGVTGVGEGFTRAAQRLQRSPAGQGIIHSLDSLKNAASELYRGVDSVGTSVPVDAMSKLAQGAKSKLSAEGYHPRLHPKVGVVLDELQGMTQGPQSLQQLSQLRRIAGSAAKSIEPDERRLASIAMDQIDEAIDGLSSAPKEARQMWGQMRRLEKVEAMIEDASNAANFEQALQSKFRTFLRNPKNTRGYSEAELQAFKKVANGGPVRRTLASLGKALSPRSLTGLAAAGGTAYAYDPTLGVALAATGVGSKGVANAMTRRAATQARDLVGSDPTRRKIMELLRSKANPVAAGAVIPGMTVQ